MQNDLFDVGADLCARTAATASGCGSTEEAPWLEQACDEVNATLSR